MADTLPRNAEAAPEALEQTLDVTSVQRRPLVPTERQLEVGQMAEEYVFADPNATLPDQKMRPGQVIKQWARDADPRGIEGPRLPLFVLSMSALLGAWDDVALGTLAPEIRAEFGISLTFLAGLTSTIGIILALVGPLMGYLADRVKRVWMIRIGALLSNTMSIAAGVSGSAGQLAGTRVGAGLAAGISQPAGLPLLTDYYPTKSRARVFSFLFAAGAFGGLIGPTVAGQMGGRLGWRSTLVVLGILATGVAFLTFLLKEPRRGEVERLEAGASAEAAAKEQTPMTFAEGFRAAKSINTVRKFWYASPLLYIGGAGASLLMVQFFASVYQLTPQQRGYLGTFGGTVGLLSLIFSGPVTDRLLAYRPGRVLAMLGTVVVFQALGLVVLSFSPWLWLGIVATLPVSIAAGLITPAFVTLISMVVPARIRGFGLQSTGWFQLIGILGFVRFVALTESIGIRRGILVFVPFIILGGIILGSASSGVERDIRAARAANLADEAARIARESGKNKMLICRDVDVEYDGVQVLFNVDFDVEEGEIIALLGTNGAGKSTLLRAIAGIQEASNGAIFLDGNDITHAPPHQNAASGVVMMPGGHATFPTLTVGENLRTAAWMYREDEEYVSARMEEVLEFFPILRKRFNDQAGNLSGGEQQMVGLGQAFLMKPRLLMIDELSLGLAPAIVEQLLDILRQIHKQGTTIILVEQSLNVALMIAERCVYMEKGEIRFSGPTEDLLAQPDLVRSVFMGGAVAGGGASSNRRRNKAGEERKEISLRVEDVAISFGGVQALRGVTLDVAAGEIVGIIGPNGAGKTTLFDAISGFNVPDRGLIEIDSNEVTGLSPDARSRIGLGRSFQSAKLFPALTVRENIAVALERKAAKNPLGAVLWSPKQRKNEARLYRRVDGLIELLGLGAFADKFLGELSTGSRRAVDVACIMAAEPKVLLLDEPSSGLAQAETEELGPVLLRVVKDTGCAMLVIEHDLPLITSVSNRLVAMELGAVVTIGTPEQVVTDKRVLASYLAASENVISRSNTRVAALASALGQDVSAFGGTATSDVDDLVVVEHGHTNGNGADGTRRRRRRTTQDPDLIERPTDGEQ